MRIAFGDQNRTLRQIYRLQRLSQMQAYRAFGKTDGHRRRVPAMQKRQHPQTQIAEQQNILFLLGIPKMRLRIVERADKGKLPGM